ncbi:TetR family transcriptional regulator [Noviherbaspirillum pedocola]|uniref:TetR family transcriptional regulator n=1 Tax=Noviherbaspirillum pedocola TaxID=2801341 RepID=UPI0038990CBA
MFRGSSVWSFALVKKEGWWNLWSRQADVPENGCERTTTVDIAQRSGISEATVFTRFGIKRMLPMQVISGRRSIPL